MQRFTARLARVSSFASQFAGLPADLQIVPHNWSANDRGGCRHAELTATGSAESLAYLCGWLGDRLEIYNEAGDVVWWGILWDLQVSLGNIQVDLSMDNVYNRVAVIYPHWLPDGTQESLVTDWVEDASSVARYGARELLYGMPDSFSESPEPVRDQLLARLHRPDPIISTQPGEQFGATLTGAGEWQRAEAVYFTNPDGLEEHTDAGGSQVIGRHITSTGISFAGNTPSGEEDRIYDTNNLFAGVQLEETLTVSGANEEDNNITFNVEAKATDSDMTADRNFVDEGAGANVKVSWGDRPSEDYLSQSFRLDTAWTCTHIALRVRKLGEPLDQFRVALYPDDGGVPGTFLTANDTLGSALFTELTWTEFAFAEPVHLEADTTYYIGIRRTGGESLWDGYEVGMDDDDAYEDGTAITYDGSSWSARDPNSDMAFRLIGEINSTEQLEKALDAVGSYTRVLVQVDSEIAVRQFVDTERTASEEINEMLDAGTSDGRRLIAWTTFEDNGVVVGVPAESDESNLILGMDGRLRYPSGRLYPPGKLIFGRYVDVDSTLLLDGLGIRASRGPAIYVQESEYSVDTDAVTVRSEGAPDPWQILSIRKG